jgi:hypothetical protein
MTARMKTSMTARISGTMTWIRTAEAANDQGTTSEAKPSKAAR